jgi:hypothetical protein
MCALALHLCPVMAALIREGDETVLRPALRTLGNFACCDSSATEAVIQCGFFSLVPGLLRRHDPLTSKETLWCLSNILADRSVHTRAALDAGLMPLVVAQARAANVDVAKEALWCIGNACTCTAGMRASGTGWSPRAASKCCTSSSLRHLPAARSWTSLSKACWRCWRRKGREQRPSRRWIEIRW